MQTPYTPPPPPQRGNGIFKWFVGCGIFVIILLLCCGILSILVLMSEDVALSEGYVEDTLQSGKEGENIVVIEMYGVITSASDGIHELNFTDYSIATLEKIIALSEDDDPSNDVSGVILKINSPGGGVYDTARIGEKIYEIQDKNIPVVTVVEDMAASGGFWLASSTDYIFIQPESFTGSIGVLMQTVDYDELFQKVGVNVITITNTEGKNKVADQLDDPESEQYRLFKDLLDESYEDFVTVIMNGRNLSRSEVIPYADGRLLSGSQAVDIKFADEFGDLDNAIEYIKAEMSLEDPTVIEYERTTISDFNGFLGKANNLLTTPSIHQTGMKLYALPTFMFDASDESEE
jgi:protease-4